MELAKKLQSLLAKHPKIKTLWVGFSGGLDSTVLLHQLNVIVAEIKSPVKLRAIHVNHGLHPDAQQWEKHCQTLCEQWSIPLIIERVKIHSLPRQSLEAIARDARYSVFKAVISENDCIVTAHHQDDQAETVLLQLLRGAGVRGLAAMPNFIEWERGYLWRPLLDNSREELLDYAKVQDLKWIDDPSNIDERFDRNFLRNQVFPLLQKRWTHVSQAFSRTASHCAEADACLTEQAKSYVAQCKITEDVLSISQLQTFTLPWQKVILREWIEDYSGILPNYNQLQKILEELINSREDSDPVVPINAYEIRRYRDHLVLWQPVKETTENVSITWNTEKALNLFDGRLNLSVKKIRGKGIHPDKIRLPFSVRFREGGERIQPAGREGTHSLKHLMQEWAIPTWRRSYIPLLYNGENLIAVADYCVAEGYAVDKNEEGLLINYVMD